ncbi:TRAP transporter small permease [Halomonas sp. DP1Y21-3]|uniref:TRAP transporter small permease n=1 Tax=Halomonas sp. DP1Y21-3 TaxID=2859080 RepID=UPI001C9418C1|nr:TRAP transporter small permease [Halomonas sp. DP1Y21-3]MBY6108825.1 TRAP transporter small permease [Halomonas sp. DP1Y21-3]
MNHTDSEALGPARASEEDAREGPQGPDIDFDDDGPTFAWRDIGLEDALTLVVFWTMAAVVFAQFFSRYVLGSPLGWTEEVARYLLICVGFLAATVGVRKRSHIRLELLYRYLPLRASAAMIWLVDLGQLVYFVLLGWVTWKILPLMSAQKMTSMAVGMDTLYSVVLLSIAIMALRQAWQLVRASGPKQWLAAQRAETTGEEAS